MQHEPVMGESLGPRRPNEPRLPGFGSADIIIAKQIVHVHLPGASCLSACEIRINCVYSFTGQNLSMLEPSPARVMAAARPCLSDTQREPALRSDLAAEPEPRDELHTECCDGKRFTRVAQSCVSSLFLFYFAFLCPIFAAVPRN